MRIYIPSSGRAKMLHTVNNLPTELHPRITLVVPQNEQAEYERFNLDDIAIAAPSIPGGIGHARQWCCDQEPEKVLMMDDDLVFASRREDEPTKFRDAEDVEIGMLIDQISAELDNYASVGVATREGGNRDISDYALNTRLLRVLAYRTGVLNIEGIRFDQIPVMEDFYVALQLLTRGYENVKLNHMVHNQGSSNSEGGCSQYRTPQVQANAAYELERHFPNFVNHTRFSVSYRC